MSYCPFSFVSFSLTLNFLPPGGKAGALIFSSSKAEYTTFSHDGKLIIKTQRRQQEKLHFYIGCKNKL